MTGASGLLGREILTAFERAGWQAVGTALSRTDGTRVVKMDLCSEEAIIDVLEEQGPDFVIHCTCTWPSRRTLSLLSALQSYITTSLTIRFVDIRLCYRSPSL